MGTTAGKALGGLLRRGCPLRMRRFVRDCPSGSVGPPAAVGPLRRPLPRTGSGSMAHHARAPWPFPAGVCGFPGSGRIAMRGALKQLPRTTPPRELVRRFRPRSERVQVSAKARSRWFPNGGSPHRCRSFLAAASTLRSTGSRSRALPPDRPFSPSPAGVAGWRSTGKPPGELPARPKWDRQSRVDAAGRPAHRVGCRSLRRVAPPARVEARAAAVPRRAGCPTPGSAGGGSSPPPTTENWTFLAIVR